MLVKVESILGKLRFYYRTFKVGGLCPPKRNNNQSDSKIILEFFSHWFTRSHSSKFKTNKRSKNLCTFDNILREISGFGREGDGEFLDIPSCSTITYHENSARRLTLLQSCPPKQQSINPHSPSDRQTDAHYNHNNHSRNNHIRKQGQQCEVTAATPPTGTPHLTDDNELLRRRTKRAATRTINNQRCDKRKPPSGQASNNRITALQQLSPRPAGTLIRRFLFAWAMVHFCQNHCHPTVIKKFLLRATRRRVLGCDTAIFHRPA